MSHITFRLQEWRWLYTQLKNRYPHNILHVSKEMSGLTFNPAATLKKKEEGN